MESTGKVWFLDEEREMGKNRRGGIPKTFLTDSESDSWEPEPSKLRSRPKKQCTGGDRSTCRSSSAREEEWLGGSESSEEIRRLNNRIKELEDEVAELKRDKKALQDLVSGCDIVRECKHLYHRMRKDVRHRSPDKENSSVVQPLEPDCITAVDAPVVKTLELVDKTTGIQHDTDHLKHKDMSTDLQELMPGSGIFINKNTYLGIKSGVRYSTRLTVAKALLEEVFTREALTTCSPLGTNSGSGPQRPALYPPAYKAILEASEVIGATNKFPEVSIKSYNHGLGSKLSKLREANILREKLIHGSG
ncbi:uncharacterized protein LOC124167099 [Ischnura elegans]|uniref:uncharacterized protein LOC124167099 n=1 Tax=Ischnura elegans TaxID=197161 RepID=UPI001ED89EB5|nr:uncharacterized protein LOC124167099 [Ischnura elegans]